MDDTFFYDYQCCMKKYEITDDIPNIPSYGKDEAELDDGVGQGESSRAGNKSIATSRED